LIDKQYGAEEISQGWFPNWRERLACSHCQLNNRQRAMLHALKEAVKVRMAETPSESLFIYAMEQISPTFHWLSEHLPQVTCIGSEYLGDQLLGGTIVNGIRHENVEALSLADQSVDMILSNDVLEHVNLPELAMVEMYRVLKPRGEIFVTIPFHLNTFPNTRRAHLVQGTLTHLLPPIYHGNPLSEAGSLVFNDFGWEFVEQLKTVGFQDVSLCHYWSYLHGYLGEPLYYFWAYK
jgi:SAM-dependent methyltransferase